MKRFIVIFLVLINVITFSFAASNAIDSTVTAKTDTSITSQIVDDNQNDSVASTSNNGKYSFTFDTGNANDTLVSIVAIIMGCGVPIFIVAAILWFRYKNRKNKYRLAEKALESGQAIPDDLFSEKSTFNNIKNKGIKNICLGIGLTVFLQILTGEEGLAAIGFLVFCLGIGQVIIAYTSRNNDENKNSSINCNNNSEEKSNSVKDSDKE